MDKGTYADRATYLKDAVTKRRRTLRVKAIEYAGGKCMRCGYDRCMEALDFHHRDEQTKSFGISQNGLTRSWDKIREEVDKCILVCANCHRELHANNTQPPMETLE